MTKSAKMHVWGVLLMVVIWPLCAAQREARFLDNLFSFGSNNAASSTTTTTASRLMHAWKTSADANIDADDVYNSLSDLFDKPSKTKVPGRDFIHKKETTTIGSEISEDNVFKEANMWKDGKTDLYNQHEIVMEKEVDMKSKNSMRYENATEYNNVMQQQYWTRFKGIVGNMKSILTQMYSPETEEEKAAFMIFDKVIELGDNVNLINRVYGTFDHELLEFLGNKWIDIKDSVVNSNPAIKAIVAMETGGFSENMAMSLLKKLGHMLHTQAFKHLGETDFVVELMRQTGFKDLEISEVFKLLEIDTNLLDSDDTSEFESRQFSRGSYDYGLEERDGGYGHSGGGYGGGGYGAQGYGGYGMQGLDPFVLLAGLAFATFLAYLIYRLLSSTAKKRGVPDMSLALDMSDLPEVMSNIYNWLERTENRYEFDDMHEHQSIEETFGESANTLWANFAVDQMSGSCMRRYLCDYVQDSSNELMGSTSTLEQLAITGLAHLLGETKGGQMIDRIQSKVLQGEQVMCNMMAPQCDDVMYFTAKETKSKKKIPTSEENKTKKLPTSIETETKKEMTLSKETKTKKNTSTNKETETKKENSKSTVQEFTDTTTESIVTSLDVGGFAHPK